MSDPLPTREINLLPADMLGLLRLAEPSWSLIPEAQGAKVTTLGVYIDSAATCHIVALRDDGTWTARTHITP